MYFILIDRNHNNKNIEMDASNLKLLRPIFTHFAENEYNSIITCKERFGVFFL